MHMVWTIGTRFILTAITALVSLGFVSPGSLDAAEKIKERSSKTEFDKNITITHSGKTYNLEATGTSLRRKWFVKGYAIAHYMQDPVKGDQETVLEDIFSSDKPKQMSMSWLHKLPLSLIKEGFDETFQKILKEKEYTSIKGDIDKYLNFYKADAVVGDIHYIRWLPGGHIELIVNDEKMGTVVNSTLGKALWNMWLGPESVVNRKKLIALVLTR